MRFSAAAQSLGKTLETIKKLIAEGIKIIKVTVIAYRIESKSLKFTLKTSISHPVKVGQPPSAIMFKIKKNKAVDIARIFIGAKV